MADPGSILLVRDGYKYTVPDAHDSATFAVSEIAFDYPRSIVRTVRSSSWRDAYNFEPWAKLGSMNCHRQSWLGLFCQGTALIKLRTA